MVGVKVSWLDKGKDQTCKRRWIKKIPLAISWLEDPRTVLPLVYDNCSMFFSFNSRPSIVVHFWTNPSSTGSVKVIFWKLFVDPTNNESAKASMNCANGVFSLSSFDSRSEIDDVLRRSRQVYQRLRKLTIGWTKAISSTNMTCRFDIRATEVRRY